MFIGYENEDVDGITATMTVGLFKSKEDVERYKQMSNREITFEKVSILDIDKIKPITYIDFFYYKDGSHGYSVRKTNTFETPNIKMLNRISLINGTVRMKYYLRENQNHKEIVERLIKICPMLVFKKTAGELITSDELNFRMRGIYTEIEADEIYKQIGLIQ